MIFYYIRHGDPIYNPDSLTPLGERQAEAIAKRLAIHGLDKIYSSPSNRAQLTAKPTCELLKKEAQILDFVHEDNASQKFAIEYKEGKTWLFYHPKFIKLMASREMIDLGFNWHQHPELAHKNYGESMEWMYDNLDAFLESLGYKHERYTGKYKIVEPKPTTKERVAVFAHQGIGMAFLSALLDIPFPMFCNHFDMGHTGMTVINFKEVGEYAIPRVLTYSDDSHIYHEGLPLKYQNNIEF